MANKHDWALAPQAQAALQLARTPPIWVRLQLTSFIVNLRDTGLFGLCSRSKLLVRSVVMVV